MNKNKQNIKGFTLIELEEQKTSILPVIGRLAIGLAVIDFVVTFISYILYWEFKPMDQGEFIEVIEVYVSLLITFTRFSLSSPIVIVFGLIGIALLNSKKL